MERWCVILSKKTTERWKNLVIRSQRQSWKGIGFWAAGAIKIWGKSIKRRFLDARKTGQRRTGRSVFGLKKITTQEKICNEDDKQGISEVEGARSFFNGRKGCVANSQTPFPRKSKVQLPEQEKILLRDGIHRGRRPVPANVFREEILRIHCKIHLCRSGIRNKTPARATQSSLPRPQTRKCNANRWRPC